MNASTVSGQQLAVFRSHSGQVYVLDAYCPHLGANLACGGRVVKDGSSTHIDDHVVSE